jgi:hypothetical protein
VKYIPALDFPAIFCGKGVVIPFITQH